MPPRPELFKPFALFGRLYQAGAVAFDHAKGENTGPIGLTSIERFAILGLWRRRRSYDEHRGLA
jgi:hypothetical protein